jgi:hypothetical protein
MEVIWLTEKVVDPETDVITHIDWSARAWEGVFEARETGRAELPQPDPDLVAEYLIRPTPEQEKRGITWDDLADPPGFIRAEWVERDRLHPWLFAIIDRGEIEARLIARIRAQQIPRKHQPDPTLLPPDPSEAKLSDYGVVGSQVPSQIKDLMEEGETVAQAKQRLTQLLWVEQAELKQAQGMKGENLKREAEIDFLLGLLARLGDT